MSSKSNSGIAIDSTIDEQKTIVSLENAQTNKVTDDLGKLIGKIEFELQLKGQKNSQDSIIPWISLETPDAEIKNLKNAKEIILAFDKVTLVIDYPLKNATRIELISTQKGFSREQLILEISKEYHRIYKEEEATATIKTIPISERKTMYNRNQTNGKYGIWGHDLGDLDLSEILVYKTPEGKILLSLDIES